ncbi:hypothetical protein CDAR_122951 [Caerostris darwini]|uniref:Secreted protein n=1 Tax=Caerostris darwini TaxID=1538125 RepID=A0AAV4NXQ5_9ARAC|nr:hypothetical protein CDAR_122951 [Caerostris darwini]
MRSACSFYFLYSQAAVVVCQSISVPVRLACRKRPRLKYPSETVIKRPCNRDDSTCTIYAGHGWQNSSLQVLIKVVTMGHTRSWRSLETLALILLSVQIANSFHMHKIMAAALLANSLQRNSFLPLPIPIPIPVKVGGNTIIALPSEDGGTTYIPLRGGSSNNCYQPPCYNMGNNYKRRGFW